MILCIFTSDNTSAGGVELQQIIAFLGYSNMRFQGMDINKMYDEDAGQFSSCALSAGTLVLIICLPAIVLVCRMCIKT